MNVIIIGSSGQLGRCLSEQIKNTKHNYFCFAKSDLDILNINLMQKKFLEIKPEIVINAAAFTAVDLAETNKDLAFKINSSAVLNLANTCRDFQTTLIHISTDYVFDGNENVSYKEDMITNPKNIYGFSKLEGEKMIADSGCNYVIIRTSWLFSEFGNNFLKTMLINFSDKEELNIVMDQIGCPTYGMHLAKAILVIMNNLTEDSLNEVYHYAGDSSCSWAEFANYIFNEAYMQDAIERKPKIIEVETKHFKRPADRPKNSKLNSNKLLKVFKIQPSNWKKGVQESIAALTVDARGQ